MKLTRFTKNFARKPWLVGLLALLGAASVVVAGPLPVDLGTASNFTILSKSGISTIGTTYVIGNMGTSPAAATAITGFSLIMDPSNQFSTSVYVNGKVYAADYAAPTPAGLTTAISDMETAFTDAAGRAPNATEIGAGTLSGQTFVTGVYKWSSNVLVTGNITLAGSSTDVWIFQISGDLIVSPGVQVILLGGAQPKNIFWQVVGAATLDTTSVFNGNILCATNIALNTGAKLNGKALAQTAVTLQSNVVTSSANPPNKGMTFAYPSPARGERIYIAYNMTESGKADIRIYNDNGDLISRAEEQKLAGPQKTRFSVKDFAPGIYLYKAVLTYDSGKVEALEVQKFGVIK